MAEKENVFSCPLAPIVAVVVFVVLAALRFSASRFRDSLDQGQELGRLW